ncbi:MAG: polyphosphate kinase 2 family protein [Chloroflexi bacterium]|nr:polyphosphate kinase 2 family protein [Chloroflexota bacterium]
MKELQPQQLIERFLVPPGKRISLPTDYDPADSAPYSSKKGTSTVLRRDLERLAAFQGRLFAQKTYAVLVILQGMDAAGKDSVVKHVMSGINPQGCQVWSFKEPSGEDLEHDYLWRVERAVPPRGMIGIFNRSYYEEVLVVRVHPQLLARQRLPQALMNKNIWRRRFDEINAFEQYLTANGIVILKFFLNISKDEQKQRFLERIERPEKNWKFSLSDVHERAHWDAYMRAYEDMLIHTSTIAAPWYVIPADRKWFTRLGIAAVIAAKLEELDPKYPSVNKQQRQELVEAAKLLEAEG